MIQLLCIFCTIYSTPLQESGMYGYRVPLQNKVDARCYENDYVRAWVYFTDKGVSTNNYDQVIQSVKRRMGKSSYDRRLKRGGTIDYADIPLKENYINEVEARGGLLIKESKWLNAASFGISKEDLDKIAELDFVQKITTVASFMSPNDTETAFLDSSIFGLTYNQLSMFNIDSLHDIGVFGSNVKIGILDTGLRRKHTALDNVMVIAEYDFLGGDQIYIENSPITEQYGVYSDMAFWKTNSRINLFLTGDTIANNYPVRDIMYTYSTDGGSVWQQLTKITSNFNNWARELAVCGADTTMFIFYQDRDGLKYLVVDTTVLVQPTILVSGVSYREPSATQIDDTVYVAYHDKNKLYLKKGNISGFSSSIIINSSTTNIKAPEVIKGDSEIGVFYHTYPEDSLYFLKSSIPVTTFTRKFVGIGENAKAISYSNTILLIWKDKSNAPLSRITFAKSTDFGETFTDTVCLSDDLNSIGKISLEKFNETITVIWETEGKIFYRTSYDNGNNFNTVDSLNKEYVYLPTLGTNDFDILKFYCTRGDTLTDGYSPNDPSHYYYPHHGTKMIGLIGGYLRDSYVGVAPAAQFLVAKTENPDNLYEYPVEEDTWITGLEWLESKGTDIVSSSLGYTNWYDWPEEYDGNTSPASIAAQEAVKRGMIIVNAAGNVTSAQIVIPGDAEGVITVGGIDTLYNRWQYSGYFPTTEHTVKKPEIMCLSAAPIVIDPDSSNSYLYSSGTSGATAMISGICALLLEGHPDWNVDSVKTALFTTAKYERLIERDTIINGDTVTVVDTIVVAPSDSMGYGWPDALAAFYSSPTSYDTQAGSMFLTPYPNPFTLTQHSNIYIPFKLDVSHTVEIRVYSIAGRLIKKEPRGLLLPGSYTDKNPQALNAAFIWDGKDENGEDVASGLYYCLLITHGGKNDIAKIAVIR
ncbi:S8 family serine peptidase [candidate division WOR-3 bacterium]|nr:S8 family serine peptidase [candidate division WOR-3 bacterium]